MRMALIWFYLALKLDHVVDNIFLFSLPRSKNKEMLRRKLARNINSTMMSKLKNEIYEMWCK